MNWDFLPYLIEPAWVAGLLAALMLTLGVVVIRILPKYKWLAAGILLLVITPIALPGFWFASGKLGVSDWDLYFTYYHHLRRTVTEFHQFPAWDPWMCGGSAALGDPEFPVFSPLFASILAFGVETGFKLNIYVVTAVGALGMLVLGKRLGFSVYAALVAALGVAFSSVNLLEVVEGHPNIFAAMWVPWIFWSWLAAYRAKAAATWQIICGIFLALTFFQSGIYLLLYTALAFLVLILLAPRHTRALRVSLASTLWALGFAAVKLVPTALWLSQFQDEAYASSAYTLPYLHKIFFGRYLHGAGEPGEVIPNQGSGWHEYGAYVGPFISALAVIGLTHIRRSRIVRALVIAAILAILLSSAGPILKPAFDHLPFIPRSNVSRIILFAVIPISLLAGLGLDALLKKTNRRWISAIVVIAALAYVSGDLFTLSSQLSTQAFVLPNPELLPPPAPPPIAHLTHPYEFRHNGVDYTRAYAAARQGYGTNAECNVLRPKQAVRTIHDRENFSPVLDGKNLTVQSFAWSPNTITARVTAHADETELMLNTNYAEGWLVKPDPNPVWHPASDIQHRVGTYLNAGDRTVVFTFRPRGRWAGVVVTAATIIVALAWAIYRRYRAR